MSRGLKAAKGPSGHCSGLFLTVHQAAKLAYFHHGHWVMTVLLGVLTAPAVSSYPRLRA